MIELKRVSAHLLELPLVHPFRTSFGEERVRRALLVSLEGEGGIGWGECVAGAGPWYSYETVDTALAVIKEAFVPLLRGRRLSHPSDLPRVLAPVRGHPMAKAALEAALWDLHARREGKPLWRIIGGVRDRIPVGVSIGIQDDIPSLLDRVAGFVEQGYRRVKLKVRPGWDIQVLEAVRERFPELPLSVDANCAYTLEDADHLRGFDRFGLMMVEQPLGYDDLLGHARLAGTLETPICLDESISSPHRAWEALELSACRIINVKQGRVGGLSAALKVHGLAQARGVPLWCGGMLETGVGRALNAALATLPGFSLPHDISATSRYYHQDIAEPPFVLTPEGTIPLPSGPGLGVEVVPERVLAFQVAAWSWRVG
ncbi:o-succinylbenzoate synthase [Candidatus Bipolaricaulota bacterium]|nr:o-succinylbenzoate synthase [Candidatus Bipolaricaulota bacterium]